MRLKIFILLFLASLGVQAQNLRLPALRDTVRPTGTSPVTPSWSYTTVNGKRVYWLHNSVTGKDDRVPMLNELRGGVDTLKALIAANTLLTNGKIDTTINPQLKRGGLLIGGNARYHTNDRWVGFGTSVTAGIYYFSNFCNRIGTVAVNKGISGSTIHDFEGNGRYNEIPRLVDSNRVKYRAIHFEYMINDILQGYSITDYCTRWRALIDTAKSRGWGINQPIYVLSGNFLTDANIAPKEKQWNDSLRVIAAQKGVVFIDIYNYTKNDKDFAVSDGVHPTVPIGGNVYARGFASMVLGGFESGSLSVINSASVGLDLQVLGRQTIGKSLITGNGLTNSTRIPANTVNGDVIVPAGGALTAENQLTGFIGRISPSEDLGSGNLSITLRNYTQSGAINFYTAGATTGSQRLSMSIGALGVVSTPYGIASGGDITIPFLNSISSSGASWISSLQLSDGAGNVNYYSRYSAGKHNFYVANGTNGGQLLSLNITSAGLVNTPQGIASGSNISIPFNNYISNSGTSWSSRLTPSDGAGNIVLSGGYVGGGILFQNSPTTTNTFVTQMTLGNTGKLSVGPVTGANVKFEVTGTLPTIPMPAMSTSAIAAITSPTQAMMVWDNLRGIAQSYNGTTWTDFINGTSIQTLSAKVHTPTNTYQTPLGATTDSIVVKSGAARTLAARPVSDFLTAAQASTNYVDRSTQQTVGGVKTFQGTIGAYQGVQLYNASTVTNPILLTQSVSTASRTQTLQDKDGVVALLSDVTGNEIKSYREITAATTIIGSDFTINITSGSFTQPLPATLTTGQVLNIKNSGTGTITVTATNLDGSASQPLPGGSSIQVQYTGTTGKYIII
jgi:hypothetical protein